VQRGLRQKLLETYPGLEPFIEDVMPKKASLEAVKLYSSPLVLHTQHDYIDFFARHLPCIQQYRPQS
jgi:hypothetical protein